MKIVITDWKTLSNGDLSLSELEKIADLEVYQMTNKEDIAKRVKDADIILCNKAQMNEETLKDANNLKYIGLFATGYNNVDVEYTNKRGITVCNAGEYSTNAVVQHTFALILEVINKVGKFNDFVKKDGWIKSDIFTPFVYDIEELSGKTIGIIGYGSIGKKVENVSKAFGMKTLVHTRTPKEVEGVDFVDLDTLLTRSDIVSIHCPLNDSSYRLINKNALNKMKKSAILINTARGPIVDEEALAEALHDDVIGFAAIDVLRKEPMLDSNPLKDLDNIIITPHVAWAALETRTRLLDIVVNNLKSFLKGEPRNVVNK